MSSNKIVTDVQVIDALIQSGEREWLEFKEGVLLRSSILLNKVSYFADNSGGILLIGISDLCLVVGLEAEYRLLQERHAKFCSLQKNRLFRVCYRNYLKHILLINLGQAIESDVQIDIVSINNKEVCVINVGQFKVGNEQASDIIQKDSLPTSTIDKLKIANLEEENVRLKNSQKKVVSPGLNQYNNKRSLAKEHCIGVLVKALSHHKGPYNIRGLLRDDKVKWYQNLDFTPHPKPSPRTLLNYYNNNKSRFKNT